MPTIGFPRSTMQDESRIAILPNDLEKMVCANLLFEQHYASHLGFSDEDYLGHGGIVVPRDELASSDILVIPKRSKADTSLFRHGQMITGWLYVDQSLWLNEALEGMAMTAVAWEKMCQGGRYVFEDNRWIAGSAGILHALQSAGTRPEDYRRIAVLGRGLVAQGVFEVLDGFGSDYEVFHTGNYSNFFEKIRRFDLIISCIRWDHTAGDFITADDIARMRDGCYLVDITSEGITGSTPQPLDSPLYGCSDRPGHSIMIYNNEHIPTLWPRIASAGISKAIAPFIRAFGSTEAGEDLVSVIKNATVMKNGVQVLNHINLPTPS